MLLVDTNVLIDIVEGDGEWVEWSVRQLGNQQRVHELIVNPIVYAEFSPAFDTEAEIDECMAVLGLGYREFPKTALIVAGLAHRHYRRAGGPRATILADFLIGAHAAVLGCGILTRDAQRYRHYFPRVPLIAP